MRKFYLTLMLACLSVAGAWAQSRVLESLEFQSKLLGRAVKYSVYLPDGYETSTRQYPTLYLLHGWTDNETSWIQMGNMQPIADEAIRSGKSVDMVIIMPDAGETWYVNSYDGKVPYEDMFFQELIPYMEKTYRLRTDKEFRAISGLSMGGFGSFLYAIHHPDYFSACAPLSAAVHDEADVKRYLKSDTGEFFQKLFGKEILTPHWYKNEILHLLDTMDLKEVSRVRFYFDCGDDDSLLDGSFAVHKKMTEKKIKHEFRVRDGYHSWTYWRTALPSVLEFVGNRFKRS